MDREDWLYASGVLLVAAGAGLFHPGVGLICAGSGVLLPFLIPMFRSGSPPKDKP